MVSSSAISLGKGTTEKSAPKYYLVYVIDSIVNFEFICGKAVIYNCLILVANIQKID